jgi:hypothetical protein
MLSARIGVRFASHYWTEGNEYTDAFSQDWNEDVGFFHPPLSDLARVMEKVKRDGARGVVVVPDWPGSEVAATYAVMYQALEGAKERLGLYRNLTWHSFRIGFATRRTVLGVRQRGR